MGKSRGDASTSSTGKRPRSDTDPDQSAKKLLANNRYAVLENADEPAMEKKEKVPPFFVNGFPAGLLDKINFFIGKGLKCTIRMCSQGYKLMTPSMSNYKAVQELLNRKNVEYFSHDVEANKPLKVVLRGLPDMDTNALMEELKNNGLKPIQAFKMNRHDKSRVYRDQLFLIHLEKNSTCLKDLQNIRALFHIVVQWERYKPVNRDVTQCMNCLRFGHGTKNCHMASRCINCGNHHEPVVQDEAENDEKMDDSDPTCTAVPKCANCGADHRATSKACPKRAEFIAIRKRAATQNQPGRRRVPDNDGNNFPALTPRHPIPVLPPLPLNNRPAPAVQTNTNVHQSPATQRRPSYAEATASPQVDSNRRSAQYRLAAAAAQPAEEPSTAPGLSNAGDKFDEFIGYTLPWEDLLYITTKVTIIKRTCATLPEQLRAILSLINHGP